MVLHDEVRERTILLRIVDKAKRHPRALVAVLDANDLRREMQTLFTWQIDFKLRDRSRSHPFGRSQKEAASGNVLDETVDDDASGPALRLHADRDSNGFPLVHLLKGTLHTHGQRINSFFSLTQFAVALAHGGPTESGQLSCNPFLPHADCCALRAHSSVGRAPAF
jgi:hypothetical protein